MRSFGNRTARGVVMAVAMWLSVCAPASAQRATPATAKARFEAASEKDEKVRVLLANSTDKTPPADLVTQVSQVMTSFEALVRRFPTSGYADNALFNAASLADTTHQRFNRGEDRDRAVKLYRWLVQEYPSSPLVTQANSKLSALTKAAMQPATPVASTLPAPATAPPQALPAAAALSAPAMTAPATVAAPAGERATLTAIQRIVLPDTVRVTLELDREVTFREERLGGPARLFFDLKNVQLTPALMDKVLTYGSDVVSKIRVGRHPDNTVRVVLDFEDVAKYSVFTLYSPFRLVIDAERTFARTVATPTVVAPVSTEPAFAMASSPTDARKPVAIAEPPPIIPINETLPAPPVAAVPSTPLTNVAGGFSIARQLGLSVSRIVIDPGHGGRDPGTIARGLTEASLTLDVALRLEKLLQKELGVEVVLTRRTDVYVPLEERTAIANRHNADLFLSIHANSSRNTSAKGIETYFLSFASSPEAEAVAARENSASEREMHHLPDLVKAITLNNKLDESRDLANMVQDALVGTLRKSNKEVRSRGVKKAPFVVLIGASMPSVLAEISFITNRQELQLLKTAAYKDRIAQALHAAVLRYRKSLKGNPTNTVDR
jgi:N-acetylmuramoyl-L-alanine amidase